VRKTNSESLAIQKELAEMEGRLCHQEETHKKLDSEFETVSKEMTSMSRVRVHFTLVAFVFCLLFL
jgi:hypothetical protein